MFLILSRYPLEFIYIKLLGVFQLFKIIHNGFEQTIHDKML